MCFSETHMAMNFVLINLDQFSMQIFLFIVYSRNLYVLYECTPPSSPPSFSSGMYNYSSLKFTMVFSNAFKPWQSIETWNLKTQTKLGVFNKNSLLKSNRNKFKKNHFWIENNKFRIFEFNNVEISSSAWLEMYFSRVFCVSPLCSSFIFLY